MQFNLPQDIQFELPPTDFRGVMEPEPCNALWQTLREAVKNLYHTCTALEMAINRQHYARLASLSTLSRRLDAAEEKLQRTQSDGTLSPIYDIDWNPVWYEYPPADVDADKVMLPVRRERNIMPARVNVSFPGALEYESDDPAAVMVGTWQAVVRSGQPSHLPRELPWAMGSGTACLLEIVFPRLQAINYISLQPVILPPVDLIVVSFVDEHGVEQKLCAPSKEGRLMESRLLTEPVEFLFPTILAESVRVLLYQRHGRRIERSNGRLWYEYYFGLSNLRICQQERTRRAQWVSFPAAVTAGAEVIYLDAAVDMPDTGTVEFDVTADGNDYLPILPMKMDGKTHSEFVSISEVDNGWRGVLRFPATSDIILYEGGTLLSPGSDFIITGASVFMLKRAPLGEIKAIYIPDRSALRLSLKDLRRSHTEEFAGTDEAGKIILTHHAFTDNDLILTLPEDWDPSLLDGAYTPIEVTIYTANGDVLTQPTEPGGEGLRNITPYRPELPPADGLSYVVEGRELKFSQPLDRDNKIVVKYESLPENVRLRVTLKSAAGAPAQLGPQVSNMTLHFV